MIGFTIIAALGIIFIVVACISVLAVSFSLILHATDTLDLIITSSFFLFLLAFIVGGVLWIFGI